MSVARIGIAIPFGAAVTASLFGMMVLLIEMSDPDLGDKETRKLPEFLMPEAEIAENKDVEKPEKPEPDEPPPDVPQQDFDDIDVSSDTAGLQVDMSIGDKSGPGLSASDGEYLPIVKVAPTYPRRALSRGIEGHVTLQFTVTKAGTVRDPVVIESVPPGVFDRAATKAVLKFKYKPRMEDGQPVEVPGVKNKIRFNMDKGKKR